MNVTIDPGFPAFLKASIDLAASQDLSESQAGKVLLISIIFVSLAMAFVALRFLSRFARHAAYAMDDWLMLVALLVLGGAFTGLVLMIDHGLGRHRGSLTQADAELLSKFLILAEVAYVIDVSIIKISILLMYYRVFPLRNMKIGGWVLGGVTTLWTIILLFIAGFQCVPLEKSWKPWVAGRCLNLKKLILGIAIPNVISDIAILSLPLPQIWRLQTGCCQKALLSAVFLLGSLVVATSIYRFIAFLGLDMRDLSYTASSGYAWSMIELSSGIISACLPAMCPLVRQAVVRIRRPDDTGLENEKCFTLQTIGGSLGSSHGLKTVDSHELDGQRRFQIPNLRSKEKEPDNIEEQKLRVMRLVKQWSGG